MNNVIAPTEVTQVSVNPPRPITKVGYFHEPLTGMMMVSIYGTWHAPPGQQWRWTASYDRSPRLTLPVEAQVQDYWYAGQLPYEPAELLTISLQRLDDASQPERIVYEEKLVPLPQLIQPNYVNRTRHYRRLLSPFKTFGRSLVRGQCFRISWWAARVERYRKLQRRAFHATARRWNTWRARHSPRVNQLPERQLEPDVWKARAASLVYRPVFSVICPVYNVAPVFLNALVDSFLHQAYPEWQLCLADDASTDPHTINALEQLPTDSRIKMVKRPTNGHIVAAANSAAELADGEFVIFVDNDDALPPEALLRYAELLQSQRDLDLIYSDEAKITVDGKRYDVQYKPAWSPDLLLSYNYLNHLVCLRRSLFEKVGRFREGFDGAQDFDLMLRVVAQTDRIAHIPEVLYYWRAVPSSSAAAATVKPYIHDSAHKALAEEMQRRNVPLDVVQPDFALKLKLPAYTLQLKAEVKKPSIAVIVYGQPNPRTVAALKKVPAGWDITTYLVLEETEVAEELNRVAAGRSEDLLLFLRADTVPQVHETFWARFVAPLQLAGVGVVSGTVFDQAGLLVSAGTYLDDRPRHTFYGMKPNPVSYYFLAESNRTITATAEGVLLTSRALFERLGGFDSRRFSRQLFDVEYCWRSEGQGYRTVHAGSATFQRQGTANDRHDPPSELVALRAAHGRRVERYYRTEFTSPPFILRPSQPAATLGKAIVTPKVLFVTHNLSGFEGAPKVLSQVAFGLHQRGDIMAEVFSPVAGPAQEHYDAAGIKTHIGTLAHTHRFFDGQWDSKEYETTLRELRAMLEKVKPDIVVANTIVMFPLIEAAAALHIPIVLIVHESYNAKVFGTAFSHFAQMKCELSFSLADRVIFVSRSCAEIYARFCVRDNFQVITNTFDVSPNVQVMFATSREQAIAQTDQGDPSHVRFISVGTVCERKAQHVLVEAAALLAKKYKNFTCLIVGARDTIAYVSYVRNLIVARGVQQHVRVIPESPIVPLYLRSSDVFVCTSYVEAYSLSVLEAQAFGLPVVSTPCGGIAEQTIEHQNALIFPFGDAEQLAQRLGFLLDHPSERIRMGKESRAGFRLHDTPEEMLLKYLAVIHSVAQNQSSPRMVEQSWPNSSLPAQP